jgi:hypothetical protein
MATANYTSKTTGGRQKDRRYLVIPALALLFQLTPAVIIGIIAKSAYGQPQWLPETWERPISLLVLGYSAAISWLLGSIGAYRLLAHCRPRIALLLIIVCCVPALLAGAVYLRALLVFLTLA